MALQRTLLDGNTGQKFSSLELLAGAAETVTTGGLPVGTRNLAPLVWDVGTQAWVEGSIIDVSIVQGFGGGVNPLNLNSDSTVGITGSVVQINAALDQRVGLMVNGSNDAALSVGRNLSDDAPRLGFFDAPHDIQPTITGSRGGNAALASLLTELANLGLIVDATTA